MRNVNPLSALTNSSEMFEFFANSKPKCPHCGEDCDIDDLDYDVYEEGEHEVSCPHCGLDFKVNTDVTYSFSTEYQ